MTTVPHGIEVRDMEAGDVPGVMERCGAADGIRVLEWETVELFTQVVTRFPGYSQIALDRAANAIVGFVFAGHDGLRGGLHHLWVDRSARRRGVARAMVGRALARFVADEVPVRRIRLIVLSTSVEALHFWERAGFIRSSAVGGDAQVVAFYRDL